MKNEVKERMEELGIRILSNARNELYLSMRFLDVALSRLEYEGNWQTFYVGTDGQKLLFQPRFLAERFEYNKVFVNRAYLHMVLHCMFRHLFEEQERNEELWNIACDIAVEYCIDGLDYRCLNKLQSEFRMNWYEKLEKKLRVVTAQGIYKLFLEENLEGEELVKTQLEFLVDDHTFWNRNHKNQDESENQRLPEEKNQLSEQWEDTAKNTATNLELFSKNIGNETKGLLRAMQIANRKRYDYREFLKKFAVPREQIEIDEDSFDYIYYMYGLSEYENMPLIEPLEYKEITRVEEFVIAIDTSGSCSGELVRRFLGETVSLLLESETFHRKVNVHVIQCDNQIQEDIKITSVEEMGRYREHFQAKGFGGTDYRPVFGYVESLKESGEITNLKGMIYFTDGMGIFPKRRPQYDVAFVFVENDYTDKLVPPWAMKIIIDDV